jgi:hypothetical protein
MKNYAEPKRIPVECQPGEEELLVRSEEEAWRSEGSEEHLDFDWQCADSLNIAVNRIGEGVFGAK